MKRSASEQAPAPFFHMILVKWAVFVGAGTGGRGLAEGGSLILRSWPEQGIPHTAGGRKFLTRGVF
ncbi:MAG: hypothetical protein ACYDBP_04130 [Leptospirales bacterium]